MIVNPQLRGITLYWYKPKNDQERSITASKLELDPLYKQLYIYSQAQANIVIRVETPKVKYQMIEVKNPEIAVAKNGTILLRDPQQLLEIKISLTPEKLEQLKAKLM
jgi:RNA-binding protein YlmH